jgi:hypothetical protein
VPYVARGGDTHISGVVAKYKRVHVSDYVNRNVFISYEMKPDEHPTPNWTNVHVVYQLGVVIRAPIYTLTAV